MEGTPQCVVVVAGGDVGTVAIPDSCLVVAADSGVDLAQRLGAAPDVVVGDLDSASPEGLRRAVDAGAEVQRHPRDKDATDLELALRFAAATGTRRIVLVGGEGGRLDHLLGNALLLASPALDGIEVRWHLDGTTVHTVRPSTPAVVEGASGDLLSLLPVGGPARGVRTAGLRWALHGDTLSPGSTRGISNELVTPRATIAVDEGVLLAVHTRSRP